MINVDDKLIINTIQFLSGKNVEKIEKQLVNNTIYVVYYSNNNEEIYRLYYEDINDDMDKQAYDNAIDLAEEYR